MEHNDYIPIDINDLYRKLTKEYFKGLFLVEDDWLIWKFSNHIMIKVSILELPHEGYIETLYLHDGKEISLTHWHPMVEEIYPDLLEINTAESFWILKKRKLFYDPYPISISKKTYASLSEKKKAKYVVLD